MTFLEPAALRADSRVWMECSSSALSEPSASGNPVKFGIRFATMNRVIHLLILTFDIAASARNRCRRAASPPSSAPELIESTIGSGGSAQKQKIAFHTLQEYMCVFQYVFSKLNIMLLT